MCEKKQHDLKRSGSTGIAAIIIGRNEGERLVRCLASVSGTVDRMVYVDSGSTDGSITAAHAIGAEVVSLDLAQPFTAARARNAGITALETGARPEYVQFIDGDCEMQSGWIETGRAFLKANPAVAIVFGRLRERFPEASIYNRLCDHEWKTPIGQAQFCGGIVMMRFGPLLEVKGFRSSLIAGEEPELCIRLRSHGWKIWCLDHEMALHDAAMTRFGQWWKRARRGGYSAAEGVALHGAPPERHGITTTRRALFWGLGVPCLAVFGALLTPWSLALFLAYPAQVIRLALREGAGRRDSWERAVFLTLGKFPEAVGVLEYAWGRLRRRPAGLIEYK